MLSAPLLAVPNQKELVKEVNTLFKEYAEILLPTGQKPSKIVEMSAEEKKKVHQELQALKKQWNIKPTKE